MIKTKNIKDVEAILGKKVARNLMSAVHKKGRNQRKPRWISFHKEKPQFHLDDGSLLTTYLADLQTGEILDSHFCGSNDTILHHRNEQLGQGERCPEGFAFLFITEYYNGKNMSWYVDVVSDSITGQLEQNPDTVNLIGG